jgi:predicted DCC family thiol-disulfide oxidoreductase YuxK
MMRESRQPGPAKRSYVAADPEFTLLFDSDCPMCRREVRWLQRRDRNGRLQAVDIAAPGFDAGRFGLSQEEVMAELCGVLPDGRVTRGMESMRRAWAAVGLGWVMAPTVWPLLRLLFDLGYKVFARYRVPLGRLFGRRCEDGRCAVGGRPPGRTR